MQGQPLGAAAPQWSTLTLGGERGFGEIEKTQAFVEAAYLLNQIGDSWHEE